MQLLSSEHSRKCAQLSICWKQTQKKKCAAISQTVRTTLTWLLWRLYGIKLITVCVRFSLDSLSSPLLFFITCPPWRCCWMWADKRRRRQVAPTKALTSVVSLDWMGDMTDEVIDFRCLRRYYELLKICCFCRGSIVCLHANTRLITRRVFQKCDQENVVLNSSGRCFLLLLRLVQQWETV